MRRGSQKKGRRRQIPTVGSSPTTATILCLFIDEDFYISLSCFEINKLSSILRILTHTCLFSEVPDYEQSPYLPNIPEILDQHRLNQNYVVFLLFLFASPNPHASTSKSERMQCCHFVRVHQIQCFLHCNKRVLLLAEVCVANPNALHVPYSTASAPTLCIHLKPLDCRILVLGQELPAVKASERSSQYLAGYQQIESNNKKVRFPGKWRVGG